MQSIRSIMAAALLIPSLASAQLAPLTGDVQANTYFQNDQLGAVVAANPTTGAFVVVWSGESQDGSAYGIFAQRFGANGTPAGSEFQVNTYTSSFQSYPAVGLDPNSGAFVVAWASVTQDSDSSGVFAQRFDSGGSFAGSEFQVNSFTSSSQSYPSIGVDPGSGAFVIAWSSRTQDGDYYGVFAQRFNSGGSLAGSEFQVNSFTNSDQRYPAVGVGPSGAFVVVWQSDSQDGDNDGVFAQRFASDGTPTGSEFRVNSFTSNQQSNPSVGVDPSSGDFVIAWQSDSQDGNNDGVFAQRFGSDGTPAGSEFQVNSYTPNGQRNATLAFDPNSGVFVVAWQSFLEDGSGDELFAQRFASDGSATGSEFQINATAFGDQERASVAARGANEFAVAWTDYAGHDGCVDSRDGIFAQRFAANGSASGAEFQVNSFTGYAQFAPTVGVNPGNGDFVVAWESNTQDGANYGVFAQRFSSNGFAAGSEFQVNTFTANNQDSPAIGMNPSSGALVVAWTSDLQDGGSYGVFAQRFASDGSSAGSEFQVNTYTSNAQRNPALSFDPSSGDFVVAWQSDTQDGNGDGIFAQRFNSDGTNAGSEFQVNTYTTDEQRQPAVGVDPSTGNFVIAWHSWAQDGFFFGVFAQRFASDGTAAGTEFQVNSYTNQSQSYPAVGMDPNTGAFVIAWESFGQDGNGFGVFAKRFDSGGAPAGSEFQVNSYTTDWQGPPVVGIDPNSGDFEIAWASIGQDGSDDGVFGQRFASDGTRSGTEFQVNSYTGDRQSRPAIGVDPGSGNFVVAWNSLYQDGCGPSTRGGAFVRLFGPATAAAVCPATPAMGCAVPTKGKLIVKDNTDDTKDKLVWKFAKGPLLAQNDFGDPVTTDGYAFCVYDDGAKKIDLTIPAGAPWEAVSTKGYQYKDSAGANDGVTKAKLLGGAAGKSKLQLKGKGTGLAVPAPASMSQLFSGATSVVVQLHGNGTCWETTFNSAQSTHKANSYKGKF